VRFEEAAEDLRTFYAATGKRDLTEYGCRLAHLTPFFEGRRIAGIGPAEATAYAAARMAEGAASGTARKELATLITMLRRAYKNNKLARLPALDKPDEGPPRSGFFEAEQFQAVRRRLRPDLQVAVTVAHVFGWRKGEVLGLERRHVDIAVGTLSLDVGGTKNDDGRVVYMTLEVTHLVAEQLARVDALQKHLGRIIPFLFPHLEGRHQGQRIRDFRKAWSTACRASGVSGRLVHDLRRTAVRNMERAGVPRSVATKLTGHRTESVYRRYAIVKDSDLQEAAMKLAGHANSGAFSGAFGRDAGNPVAEAVRI
jgi:integrase